MASGTTNNTRTEISACHDSSLPPKRLENDDELPCNVDDAAMLDQLPDECLSGDPKRPLRHVDDQGYESHYALQPLFYCVVLILAVECFERFSFYSICYTQTMYLTGVYNPDWNAGFTSVDAASFVAISTAIAYTTTFIGATLADVVFGEYKSILIGALGLYIPGLLLLALTTVPYLLGDEFNTKLLSLALLVLWPLGTGIVKSCVNVFGAKQFHPLLQSALVERYYVIFYMAINIGSLAGIILVPIVAQYNITLAYCLPVSLLGMAICLFVSGTPRYVIGAPKEGGGGLLAVCNGKRGKRSKAAAIDPNAPNTIPLFTIFRITALTIPFNIAYSQMPTTFIVQGTVMKKAFGVIDVATMNSLDAVSVLIFGSLTGNVIYPALARRNIKIPTTYKFALGSFLALLAIGWALVVEHWIHDAYHSYYDAMGGAPEGAGGFVDDAARVSVLWLAPCYFLIGWGEIFVVSTAYEVSFKASSPEKKALASAINIFSVGGIPNFVCIFLYQACQGWFRNARGDTNLQHLGDYATAHIANYFVMLLSILVFGILLNLYPSVSNFVARIENQAADLLKTPIIRRPTRADKSSSGYDDEESPLLRTPKTNMERHQNYLKYGKGPVLHKNASMRAGPAMSDQTSKQKKIKAKDIHKLYGHKAGAPGQVHPPKIGAEERKKTHARTHSGS